MATANGTLTPPEVPDGPSNRTAYKRKHDDGSLDGSPLRPVHWQQIQKDMLEILRKHDTNPSFLDFEILHSTSSEPVPKKARLSNSSENKSSISATLAAGSLPSLDRLRQDAARVGQHMIAQIRSKDANEDSEVRARPSIDDLKQIQRINAMEQLIKDMANREDDFDAAPAQEVSKTKQEGDVFVNGAVKEQKPGALDTPGMVLTLFGNAPTPKQLFSSLQDAKHVKQQPTIKAELPIEEMSLPNGLTATKIMPSAIAESKKGPTFAEAFPPPYSLSQLSPPKIHKRSSTKDNTVSWEFKEHSTRGSRNGGYTTQSLTVADWLGYGGVDPPLHPSSPREKRRQRDRALSSGADSVQTAPTVAPPVSDLERHEEALFRRAYSSFAPTHDNSRTLVDAETKSLVWWHKVGNRQFNERFGLDPALRDESSISAVEWPRKDEDAAQGAFNDAGFGKILEEYDDSDQTLPPESDVDMKIVDQVLLKISELLQTLASQQRARNATLPSSTSVARTPISPAPSLAAKIGKPDSPAEDEVQTYDQVRREIAYLVLQLPPYAVAKLDGDQLADLGVSRLIAFSSSNYKGQLEEDQVTRLSKYTAAAAAAGVASLTRPGSANNPHYSSSARTPAIGQAANTRYGQSASFGSGRTPVTAPAYNRSTSQSNFNTPTAAPRSHYAQPNQYTRPVASQQQSYGQTNGQQQYYQQRQQAAGGYGTYGANYGQNSSQQRPNYSSSQPLQQFQQRSQAAAANAVGYQTSAGIQTPNSLNRTASPVKPNYSAYANTATSTTQQQQQQQQQQPGSGRVTPVNYISPAHTPVNGLQQARAPPPLIARAPSGTPQPQMQGHAQVQGQQSVVNGHA